MSEIAFQSVMSIHKQFFHAQTGTLKRNKWSVDTIDDLVQRHFNPSSEKSKLSVKPLEEIAIVGAIISPNGLLDARDRDYIDAFFSEIAAAGIPVSPKVAVTNYNLNNGTDIFDRNQMADALLLCNLNKMHRSTDLDEAIIYNGSDEADKNEHYFHISPKSVDPAAWFKLAERLCVKIVAAYGFGRSVGIESFTLGKQVHCNYLHDPSRESPALYHMYRHSPVHYDAGASYKSACEKWQEATGGTWREFRKLSPEALQNWKDDPLLPPPPLLAYTASDIKLCQDYCEIRKYSGDNSYMSGQHGLLKFGVSRALLDEATMPTPHLMPLLSRLAKKSVMCREIETYAMERNAGGYLNYLACSFKQAAEPQANTFLIPPESVLQFR